MTDNKKLMDGIKAELSKYLSQDLPNNIQLKDIDFEIKKESINNSEIYQLNFINHQNKNILKSYEITATSPANNALSLVSFYETNKSQSNNRGQNTTILTNDVLNLNQKNLLNQDLTNLKQAIYDLLLEQSHNDTKTNEFSRSR